MEVLGQGLNLSYRCSQICSQIPLPTALARGSNLHLYSDLSCCSRIPSPLHHGGSSCHAVLLNSTANILNGEILKFFFRGLGQREQQTEHENKLLNDTIYNSKPQSDQLVKDMQGLYSENYKTHVLTCKDANFPKGSERTQS